jgi:hypothetical protein
MDKQARNDCLEICLARVRKALLEQPPFVAEAVSAVEWYARELLVGSKVDPLAFTTPLADERLGLTQRMLNSLEQNVGAIYLGQLLNMTWEQVNSISHLEASAVSDRLGKVGLKLKESAGGEDYKSGHGNNGY